MPDMNLVQRVEDMLPDGVDESIGILACALANIGTSGGLDDDEIIKIVRHYIAEWRDAELRRN